MSKPSFYDFLLREMSLTNGGNQPDYGTAGANGTDPAANLIRHLSESPDLKELHSPELPEYDDDWDIERQPKGSVQFLHTETDPVTKEVVVTQFQPALEDSQKATTYKSKRCPYPMDATPTQAGFSLPINKLLDQWRSTAISGNDITSSILYSAGLVAGVAGFYAPICLLMVILLLYFFRSIYVELVTALPLNGGTYTGLLNTSRKSVAVIAAVLSFLSYAATVVVSATSAIEYLRMLWKEIPVVWGTIAIVVLFALIMLSGIRESSIVATVIFAVHIVTLMVVIASGIAVTVLTKGSNLVAHYTLTHPDNPFRRIVLGFSKAMLGITGFETSANFIQEQAPGVFSKTLRNMWILVALINPTVELLGFAVIPMDQMYVNNQTVEVTSEVINAMVALMGREMGPYVGGDWLQKLIIVDAMIVLSGSVLTGYVGVTGLLQRMVDDDILPRVFVHRLPCTGANYAIILSFCSICVTMILLTWGRIESISGVYTVAFLSVMMLFCVANLFLKNKRRELKRETRAHWWLVILCIGALIVAVVGNCMTEVIIIGYAALYISIFFLIFFLLHSRTFVIRGILHLLERNFRHSGCARRLRSYLVSLLVYIEKEPVVFFSHRLNLREMNLAVQRIYADELSRNLYLIHFYQTLRDIPESLRYVLDLLDSHMYPSIRINVLLIQGSLGPGAIRLVESILEIPPNRMFIASPSRDFPYNIAELGSVRIIMGRKDRKERPKTSPVGDGLAVVSGGAEGSTMDVDAKKRLTAQQQHDQNRRAYGTFAHIRDRALSC